MTGSVEIRTATGLLQVSGSNTGLPVHWSTGPMLAWWSASLLLVYWSSSLLVCWSRAGLLVFFSTGPLVYCWSTTFYVYWYAGVLVYKSTGSPVYWSAGLLVYWSVILLVNWSVGLRLVYCWYTDGPLVFKYTGLLVYCWSSDPQVYWLTSLLVCHSAGLLVYWYCWSNVGLLVCDTPLPLHLLQCSISLIISAELQHWQAGPRRWGCLYSHWPAWVTPCAACNWTAWRRVGGASPPLPSPSFPCGRACNCKDSFSANDPSDSQLSALLPPSRARRHVCVSVCA